MAGGWWDWLTPFSLLAGYAPLGATWLIMKTEGPVQERMRARAGPLEGGGAAIPTRRAAMTRRMSSCAGSASQDRDRMVRDHGLHPSSVPNGRLAAHKADAEDEVRLLERA